MYYEQEPRLKDKDKTGMYQKGSYDEMDTYQKASYIYCTPLESSSTDKLLMGTYQNFFLWGNICTKVMIYEWPGLKTHILFPISYSSSDLI